MLDGFQTVAEKALKMWFISGTCLGHSNLLFIWINNEYGRRAFGDCVASIKSSDTKSASNPQPTTQTFLPKNIL